MLLGHPVTWWLVEFEKPYPPFASVYRSGLQMQIHRPGRLLSPKHGVLLMKWPCPEHAPVTVALTWEPRVEVGGKKGCKVSDLDPGEAEVCLIHTVLCHVSGPFFMCPLPLPFLLPLPAHSAFSKRCISGVFSGMLF